MVMGSMTIGLEYGCRPMTIRDKDVNLEMWDTVSVGAWHPDRCWLAGWLESDGLAGWLADACVVVDCWYVCV